jgi:hypothetical protein
MKKTMLGLMLLCGLVFAQEATSLTARDGLRVYSSFYPAVGHAKATVLAFHQADNNKSEYASIAPRLTKLGFNVLTVDQRSGASNSEGKNETVEFRGGARVCQNRYSYQRRQSDRLGQQLQCFFGFFVGAKASRNQCGHGIFAFRFVPREIWFGLCRRQKFSCQRIYCLHFG